MGLLSTENFAPLLLQTSTIPNAKTLIRLVLCVEGTCRISSFVTFAANEPEILPEHHLEIYHLQDLGEVFITHETQYDIEYTLYRSVDLQNWESVESFSPGFYNEEMSDIPIFYKLSYTFK